MDLGQISAQFRARPAGHSLPQPLYNSAEAFDFDLAAIFGRNWLFAGFAVEVRAPGDYLSFTVGRWPILIMRDRGGELGAFHNSCRHRGSVLCQPGSGKAARIVCPYHRWTYGLDGRLLAAGRMPDDFSKADHGLKPIRLELVSGAMFICLADDAPDIETMRRELTPLLAPHGIERSKLAFQSTLVEHANWKLVMENARECYHCATGHPELSLTFPVNASAYFDIDPGTSRAFEERMAAADLPMGPAGEEWWQAVRFPLNEGTVAMTTDGQFNVKKLMCEAAGGASGSMRWAIEPNVFCHSTSEYTFAFTAWPVSPTETHVVSRWLVHEDAVEGVDYDIDTLADLWTRTNLQDKELAENNQRGIWSPGYTPGPYSPDAESLTLLFVDWYCATSEKYLAEAGA